MLAELVNANSRKKAIQALRLGREYILDFNLEHAAIRADIDFEEAKRIQKLPVFHNTIRELIETVDADTVASRTEILLALKREMYNYGPDASAQSRIAAAKELARLAGHDLPTQTEHTIKAPIINLILAPVHGSHRPEPQLALPPE
jgi:hypothetical protein